MNHVLTVSNSCSQTCGDTAAYCSNCYEAVQHVALFVVRTRMLLDHLNCIRTALPSQLFYQVCAIVWIHIVIALHSTAHHKQHTYCNVSV